MQEFLYKTYNMVLERLRYAEAKNAIIVTLLGALIIGGFRIYDETPYRPQIATIYFWVFIFFGILAVVTALTAFMPNIKLQYLYKNKTVTNADSLIYYEDISKYDAKSYIDAINAVYFKSNYIPGNLEYDLAAQIILNSRSIYRKSVLSYYAIIFSVCAIITPFFGLIFVLMNHYMYWTVQDNKTKLKFGKKDSKEEMKELRYSTKYNFSRFFKSNSSKTKIRDVSQSSETPQKSDLNTDETSLK